MNLGFITTLLLVIGGLNWGLIGLMQFNLVHSLTGSFCCLENGIYGLVGLSAVYHILQGKLFGSKS